jgi:hypothetical protein
MESKYVAWGRNATANAAVPAGVRTEVSGEGAKMAWCSKGGRCEVLTAAGSAMAKYEGHLQARREGLLEGSLGWDEPREITCVLGEASQEQ